MAEVKRKFHYFKVERADPSFLVRLEKVNDLNPGQKESFSVAGHKVLIEISHRNDRYVLGSVRWLRGNELPLLGEPGDTLTTPVNALPNQQVVERSHFVYVISQRHLVYEYNQFGPRAHSLLDGINFLYHKFYDESADYINWSYVARGGVMERIRDSQGLVMATISVAKDAYLTSEHVDPYLKDTFKRAEEEGDAEKVSVTLKTDKSKRVMGVPQFMRRFVQGINDNAYSEFKVKVVNSAGRIEDIDILNDKVVSTLNIVKLDQHRCLKSQDLFEKVIKDYEDRTS